MVDNSRFCYGGRARPSVSFADGNPEIKDIQHAYIGKRTLQILNSQEKFSARPATATGASHLSKLTVGTKTFYPKKYFDHVGYEMSEAG